MAARLSISAGLLLRVNGKISQCRRRAARRWPVTFSCTQVSQYLRCPRSYRFRYLDGWREKDSRAALCFGRCFEKAIAALFERGDAGAVLFKEWGPYRDVQLEYSHGDDWQSLLRPGLGMLAQFPRPNRIRVRHPKRNLPKKTFRTAPTVN